MKILRSLANDVGSGKFNGKAFAESIHWTGVHAEPEKLVNTPPVMTFRYQVHTEDRRTYAVLTEVNLIRWLLLYPQHHQDRLLKDAVEGMTTNYPVVFPQSPRLLKNILPVSVWNSLKRMSAGYVQLHVRRKPETFFLLRPEVET